MWQLNVVFHFQVVSSNCIRTSRRRDTFIGFNTIFNFFLMKNYLSDNWNRIDIVLVVGSVIDAVLDLLKVIFEPFYFGILSCSIVCFKIKSMLTRPLNYSLAREEFLCCRFRVSISVYFELLVFSKF